MIKHKIFCFLSILNCTDENIRQSIPGENSESSGEVLNNSSGDSLISDSENYPNIKFDVEFDEFDLLKDEKLNRLVFVTSRSYNINFGSLDLADRECNYLAAIANLQTNKEYNFKAWLSTRTTSVLERFFHSEKSYILTNGKLFANNWESLINDGPINFPNSDEFGIETNVAVWTGTLKNGTSANFDNCNDYSEINLTGRITWGYSKGWGPNWTQWYKMETNPTDCLNSMHLYCFEQ